MTQSCGAIIVAAGSSRRMGGETSKMFLSLGGKTVIERTLAALSEAISLQEIVLVCRKEDRKRMEETAARFPKVKAVTEGGETRSDSVEKGLALLSPACGLVAIHDGARPLVSAEEIEKVIGDAERYGAAALAVPVKDTVKIVNGEGFVEQTPRRSTLWAVQTPQVFVRKAYEEAVKKAKGIHEDVTDDCQLMERMGVPVFLTRGSYGNLKITTPEDLTAARASLREGGSMRIGHGYDVHRFAPDRKLKLGGVEIPFEAGLLGHSDADVLLHAIADALLGAAALGDIGRHFPDTDEKWRGADSREILKRTAQMVKEAGLRLENLDCTVIAQTPKLAPYIDAMRESIAACLGVSPERVSVKATTEEGLGFTGRKEGIAAHAVCLLA